MSMLKNIKKNKETGKKQTKTDTKKKNPKQDTKLVNEEQQEQNTDLVDVNQLKQDNTKVKQNARKKNQYQLEQKQIDISNIDLTKNEKPKAMTSWVANSVDEVNKKDFKIEKIDHQFMSLTDQELNKKLQQKQKEEQKNAQVKQQNNLNVKPIEKSVDQLRLQRQIQQPQFNKNTNMSNQISTTGSAINFTNSNLNAQFKPIQKTAQQLKMQEAQRKEQQLALKKPSTAWIGTKKAQDKKEPAPFKVSVWATMATQENPLSGQNVKFAPLNQNDLSKQPKKQDKSSATINKPTGSTSSNTQTGIKFAPLNISKQEQKLMSSGRQQQQFVFVSKKQKQQRMKKRQQKQKANQNQPNQTKQAKK